jgi:hypothetical protein
MEIKSFNQFYKLKIIKAFKDNKHVSIAFILLVCLSVYVSHRSNITELPIDSTPVHADTLLPKGFILYPIRLENIDAIKGVIDQYGVIDIYTSTKNRQKSKKILSKVKIMQAPFNPNEYAVLIPDYLSQTIMSEPGPFLGVIQNRAATAEFNEPEKELKTKKVHIEYQTGAGT